MPTSPKQNAVYFSSTGSTAWISKSTDMRYELITYWSKEDNEFLVEVSELAGCMADGKAYEEAVTNAQTVIADWIKTARSLNRPIPESK